MSSNNTVEKSIEESMDLQSEDILELRYITKDNSIFSRTSGGFVSLDYADKHYDRISVYRTFPFTEPDQYISIREPDEKAREIGMIKSLIDLSKDQQEMLREQLNLRYFTPIIEKINDIKDEYGFAYFDVLTNYGACRFTIHMGGGSVVSLSDHRLLITDLDGNRFEIPDIYKLSSIELKKLDLFI
jgi:hypothetical protein